jgi:hypothetical protein
VEITMRISWTACAALPIFAVLFTASATSPVFATDCSEWPQFQTSEPDLAPKSLQLSDLQNVLNAGTSAEGMIFDFRPVDRDIWVDVTYVPGNATALAGMRTAFMAFRLLSDDFDNFVFSDDKVGLYKISEPVAREIGCQFIWGKEGGQNPIYLLRVFFKSLMNYEDSQPAVVGFNGSLLGDTNVAMQFNNEVFVRKWLLTAVQE